MNNSSIALIPARGGSKRLPKKNIRILGDKPLIWYSIFAAKSAGIKDIIVSTDCPQTAEIAVDCGAMVPCLRPSQLATDEATDAMVITHFLLEMLPDSIEDLSYLVFLRPTIPFRKPIDIERGIEICRLGKQVDVARSISRAPYPPYWIKKLSDDGFLEPFCSGVTDFQYLRSQDLPETVFADGNVDVFNISSWLDKPCLENKSVKGFMSSQPELFVDIDDGTDWLYAEFLLSHIGEVADSAN